MINARTISMVGLALLGSAAFALPATADWNPGDPYKMHYPQLPDLTPTGIDVLATKQGTWVLPPQQPQWKILADDWKCTETGPVTDIHFWLSFKEWNETSPPPGINNVSVQAQIWSNNPNPTAYSMPLAKLWEDNFTSAERTIRYYGLGNQGWFWPGSGTTIANDHTSFFQINIEDIVSPFPQVKDEIYWLVLRVPTTEDNVHQPGWKTANVSQYPPPNLGQHFMDDGVYQFNGWKEIVIESESRDLSFVITTIPEPATAVLVASGLLMVLGRLRRRG